MSRRAPLPPSPPSVRAALAHKLKGWALIISVGVGFCAFVGALVGGWTYIGGPVWVSNHALSHAVTTVKGELTGKIESTKNEVLDTAGKNTAEVRGDVGVVKKTLDLITKTQERQDLRTAKAQVRVLFLQKQQITGNVAGIDTQLRANPNDAFLIQRRAEITSYLQIVERELTQAQDEVTALERGPR